VESNQLVTIREGQGIVSAPLQGAKSPSKQGPSTSQK
jgi:hypothetical protein